jgi:hypothetical protein
MDTSLGKIWVQYLSDDSRDDVRAVNAEGSVCQYWMACGVSIGGKSEAREAAEDELEDFLLEAFGGSFGKDA